MRKMKDSGAPWIGEIPIHSEENTPFHIKEKTNRTDNYWNFTGIKDDVIDEIRNLSRKHGMTKVILFGSRARGDFRRESDIDLAISGGNADLFRLAVEENTSTLLQYDVVNLDLHLQPGLRETIEKEGKVLYEKV